MGLKYQNRYGHDKDPLIIKALLPGKAQGLKFGGENNHSQNGRCHAGETMSYILIDYIVFYAVSAIFRPYHVLN